MKGVKKCFGLSLLLFIMVGLSLSVCSDVNATKYSIDVLPFWEPGRNTNNPNFYTSPNGFQITSSNDFDTEGVDWLTVSSWKSGESSGTSFSGPCSFVGFTTLPRPLTSGNDVTLKYAFNGFDFNSFTPTLASDPCLTVLSMTEYNTPANLNQLVRDNLPYRFPFSGIYRSSSGRLNDDGPILDTKFDIISLYHRTVSTTNVPSVIKSIKIPFGYPASYRSFSSGTPIEFSGEFVLDPKEPVDFAFNATVSLEQRVLNGNGDVGSPTSISCSTSTGLDVPDDVYSVRFLRYTCSTTVSSFFDSASNVPWFSLNVDFSYTGSSTQLNMLIFDSAVSVTNNDSTDGGSWFDTMYGSNTSQAFGSIKRTEVISEPNFLQSLAQLFNFNFINPFAPIFNLFNNNDSCANIPILAGMLHSESTQVCPWFDSTTRNIVTPVLGLASMMLVFGFAVRWLGARSGNFIEDSGGVDSGGVHFENKYRRKK